MMNLNETAEIVTWPPTHYVFVEKIGPFHSNAPQAWQSLHTYVPRIAEPNQITGYTSLYKVGPQVYRAGVSLAAAPQILPQGVEYVEFPGGKYSCFTLTGSYSNLGPASGRVQQIIKETGLPLRDDYFIENYRNDPRTTPEAELITEIMVPTA
jgi:effector-binding domain-containing protein